MAHPSGEQQPRPWTEALESQAPGCGTGAGRADSYSRSCCGARLSPGLLCPPAEARPWASCTRDPLLGPPGSGEVSGPELGVREASARAGPLVPRPRLNGGVMFQQGGVSQLCVDAVACASDELEAANLPPSKRRKEDAAWVEVADMLPADPEQVCAHSGGRSPSHALRTCVPSAPRPAGTSDARPARGCSVAEPCPQDSALLTEDALLTLNFSFYHVHPAPQSSVHRCISCETLSFEMRGDARAKSRTRPTRCCLHGRRQGPGAPRGPEPSGAHVTPVTWVPKASGVCGGCR